MTLMLSPTGTTMIGFMRILTPNSMFGLNST